MKKLKFIPLTILLIIGISFGAPYLGAEENQSNDDIVVNEEPIEEETTGGETEEVETPEPELEPEAPVEEDTETTPTTETTSTPAPFLAANEVIVTTDAQLRSAITTPGNGITTIYLGADIQLLSGITVPAAKTTFIIDGVDPNTQIRHTLTEVSSAAQVSTIFVNSNSAGPGTITLRNLDIQGRNYYGTVSVGGNLNMTLVYDNITYFGPQITYNPYGRAIYRNSTITIPNQNFATSSEQVGEVLYADFEGNVTVNHTPTTQTYMFYVALANGRITFKEGSNVTITTNRNLNNPSATMGLVVEQNANVQVTQTTSLDPFYYGTGGSFQMFAGSTLSINRTAANYGFAAIWMDATTGTFEMNGATLSVTSQGNSNGYPTLNIPKPTFTNSTVNVETLGGQSQRVLYSRGDAIFSNSNVNVKINGNETAAEPMLDIGTNTFTSEGSEFHVDLANSINGAILRSNTTNLTNSEINYKINGSITSVGIGLNVTTLKMDNSKLNGVYSVNSGTALQVGATITNIENNSEIKFSTPTTGQPLINFLSTFNLKSGSKFDLNIDTVTAPTASPISIANGFLIDADTTTKIVVGSGAVNGAIIVRGGSQTIQIFNPKSFIIYAPTAAKVIYNTDVLSVLMRAQQINQWSTYNGFETSGTLDHLPTKRFIKSSEENYFIFASVAGGATGGTTINSSNYVAGDGLNPSGNLSFKSSDSRIFSMGIMSLALNEPVKNDVTVTGTATPTAAVRFSYINAGANATANGVSAADGNFAIATSPIDAGDYTLDGNWNYLYLKRTGSIIYVGALKFLYVPTTVDFGTVGIPAQTTTFPRTDTNWNIQIQDDRTATSNWELLVKVVQPLTPSNPSRPNLDGALVFTSPNGTTQALSEASPTFVTNSVNGPQFTTLTWAANRGILLRVQPGAAYSGTNYTGTIEWILQDTP